MEGLHLSQTSGCASASDAAKGHKVSMGLCSVILLCFAMAAVIGGGIYESVVLAPICRKSPPASFSIIQPGTGIPLQRFWIPVHVDVAIALFGLLPLRSTWNCSPVRLMSLQALPPML